MTSAEMDRKGDEASRNGKEEVEIASEQAASKKKRFNKTRKTFRFLLAVDAWKRNARNLQTRLRFDLLRRVIHNEKKAYTDFRSLQTFKTESLEKSVVIHTVLLVVMSIFSCWSVFCLIRGIAILIRFDIFTGYLFLSIPLLIMSSARAYISYKSIDMQKAEILERSTKLRANV